MIERKTREFFVIPIANKNTETVLLAFKELKSHYEEHFSEVFKTITTDNGSEFADLSNLEDISKTLIYYAHPYTSCKKGSVDVSKHKLWQKFALSLSKNKNLEP